MVVAAILLLMRMLTRSLLTYMVAKLMITCTTPSLADMAT